MRRTVRLCVVLGLALAAAANPSARAGNPALERRLQAVLDSFLTENPIAPGATACVICPAQRLNWCGAAGMAARGDTTRLTPRHTFRIASNTKTYVAAASLRLVEMGRLGLDDPLRRHLAARYDSLLTADGYDTGAITIAHVLSHTAGLADHTNDPRFEETILNDHAHPWTSDEQIHRLVEWCDPLGKPGERFRYSDSGYVLLGTIVERMTGRPLGPAVRKLVDFERLGLTVTYWEYLEQAPSVAGPRAHQYLGDADVTDWNASFDLYGGGGIVTDTRELALFMRALLHGSVLTHPSTLAAMTSRGTDTYRLGLMVQEFAGHRAFGHQGFWNSFAFHVPSLDLTVSGCILNHDATNGKELARRLVEVVAGWARRSR